MLAKLILIKACTYDLAELDFSQGDSMQLVGGNNVGKSSLIYALNFLFVIHRKRMSFMGRKPAAFSSPPPTATFWIMRGM